MALQVCVAGVFPESSASTGTRRASNVYAAGLGLQAEAQPFNLNFFCKVGLYVYGEKQMH